MKATYRCTLILALGAIALGSFASPGAASNISPQTSPQLLAQRINLAGRRVTVRTPEGGPLNVRSGPGGNYRVVRTLRNGGQCVLSGRTSGAWVQLQGGGWVTSIYLDI
ncbi:SH3 domain-containing protein [Oscillatoria sp. FACHB-1406]|uniref:SH3 domain-containing protein n=1 Tax=Oscillatoria sp. FACHB-1406 TaxID=2692846 RepID=UPI001688E2B8|nr:SH3 domain-containing protein [Oscillatoria sp. FACHB-1406]MBD2576248.1 SH3 domain-containing protein [Oscillatoria sp. FACHB-1406]